MSQTKAQLIDNLVQPITGAAGSASAPTFSFTSDPNSGLYSVGADQLALSTGGSGRLFVNSNGQVGVGGTESNYSFGVHGTNAGGYVVSRINNTNATGFARILFDINSGTNGQADISYVPGTFFAIGPSNNDTTTPIVFRNNNAQERLRITSAGDLCFGSQVGANNDGSGISIYHASNPRLSFRNSTTGNTAANGSQLYLINSNLYITNNENADLVIRTNAAERLRITSGGTVGIGTNGTVDTSSLLHVFNTAGVAKQTIESANNSEAYINFSAQSSESSIGYVRDGSGNGSIRFTFGNNLSSNEVVRIDVSGRLLVGTSSSIANVYVGGASYQSPFQVIGNAAGYGNGLTSLNYSAGGYGATLTLGSSKNATVGVNGALASGDDIAIINFAGNDGTNFRTGAYIIATADATVSTADVPTRLSFWTKQSGVAGPTERMRLTNDGKALFGGTTSTTAKWNFWDTDSTGMAWLSATTSGNYRRAYLWGSAGSQGLYFTNGNNEANLSSAGAWTNASDARIKKDIEPISYGLAEVIASQPRKYKMIADDQECIGFIAQEMLEIVPEVVSGGETEDRKYCLDYGSLVAVAFKAIQEQQTMIAELQTEVAALKSQ